MITNTAAMKQGITEICHQLIGLLEMIDTSAYNQPIDLYQGSTLGQHFRHILEFFENVEQPVEGVIDYANRKRNPILETDTAEAAAAIYSFLSKLQLLNEAALVRIKGDYHGVEPDNRPLLQSTVGRELMFAYDHAIHHLAIIKMGLRELMPHLVISDTIGLAPSTSRFRNGN